MSNSADNARVATVFDDDSGIWKSYAEAFLGASGTVDAAESAVEELEEFLGDVWHAHPRFAALLGSASLPSAEKDRLLTSTLDGRALPVVSNFLRVLNRHGRLGHLPAIVGQVRATLDRKRNRVPVRVITAVPLDDASRGSLVTRLQTLIQADPVLHLEVDPTLIGGLILQVGDDVYDASVRTRLARMRDRLFESQTHEIQSRRDHFSHSA
ncbi:MAG: ATP synthase F1 subunit delta [Isosphaeraceae bacterium]|nr:ATP synthase F1 subunit delta [Isosphaeraceae bacterium]